MVQLDRCSHDVWTGERCHACEAEHANRGWRGVLNRIRDWLDKWVSILLDRLINRP